MWWSRSNPHFKDLDWKFFIIILKWHLGKGNKTLILEKHISRQTSFIVWNWRYGCYCLDVSIFFRNHFYNELYAESYDIPPFPTWNKYRRYVRQVCEWESLERWIKSKNDRLRVQNDFNGLKQWPKRWKTKFGGSEYEFLHLDSK